MPKKKLDILIIGLHYAPETTGNAPYTSGLAAALAQAGHAVRVLTGYPHYPTWRRDPSYSGWTVEESIGGVPVRRLRHTIPASPTMHSRILMEVTFGLRAITSAWKRPDLLLLVSPTLFSAGLALLRAQLQRRRLTTVIWVQDLYSHGFREAHGASGIFAHLLEAIESRVLRGASGVVVIHERFATSATTDLGVDPKKIKIIRNWTHLRPFKLVDRAQSRASFGWEAADIVVLHAGNMGAKQGLDNVVFAAQIAEARGSYVRFVLVGSGNQRARLENLAVGAQKLTFHNSMPGTRFQEALAAADILLVNELPGVKDMSVPSKLTSYFSSGVPVLAATDTGSVTAEEIDNAGAGARVDAGDPAALVSAAEELAANPELARRFADNGRRYMETTLSEERAVAQYDLYLTQLVLGL